MDCGSGPAMTYVDDGDNQRGPERTDCNAPAGHSRVVCQSTPCRRCACRAAGQRHSTQHAQAQTGSTRFGTDEGTRQYPIGCRCGGCLQEQRCWLANTHQQRAARVVEDTTQNSKKLKPAVKLGLGCCAGCAGYEGTSKIIATCAGCVRAGGTYGMYFFWPRWIAGRGPQ